MSDSLDATPDSSSDASESLDNETIENELDGTEDGDEWGLTDDGIPEDTDEDESPEPKKKPETPKPTPKPEPKKAEKAQPKQSTEKRQPKELADADMDDIVKVKIDGEVKTMTVRELTKIQSLEQVSQRRMQEAAEERRKAQSLIQLAMTDREKFLELAGVKEVDREAEALELLSKKFQREQMTPEQRELEDLRAEKQRQEKMEAQSKEGLLRAIEAEAGEKIPEQLKNLPKERLEKVLADVKETNRKTQVSLDEEIGGAWKASGLPKHPRFVQLIAQTMRNSLRPGKQPLQAKEAAAIVKRDFALHVREILEDSSMDAKAIQEILGEKTLAALRKADVERVTGRSAASLDKNERPANEAASQRRAPKQREMSPYEARKYMADLKKTLRD